MKVFYVNGLILELTKSSLLSEEGLSQYTNNKQVIVILRFKFKTKSNPNHDLKSLIRIVPT